jgi:uncharacterized protein (TIGR00369 family)
VSDVKPEDLSRRRDKCLEYIFTKVPYNVTLKLELLEADDSSAKVRMPFQEFVDNGGTTYHGGAVASLLDSAGGAAAWAGHDFARWPARGSTVSLTINFVGAGRDDDLIATAKVVRRAKELQFIDVVIESSSGACVGSGVMVYRIVT